MKQFKKKFFIFLGIYYIFIPHQVRSQTTEDQTIDIKPEIIQDSPVLQRWLKEIPNILEDIKHDPAFRTRLRLGYSQFPSSDDSAGINGGVEDVFIGKTGLTLRADYQTSFNGKRESVGADLQYYILPLGYPVNIAPVVGYRYIETNDYSTDGVNVGLKLMLPLSRKGAADISVTQSFVSPGTSDEVGITSFTVGYALTSKLRLAADISAQNSREAKDNRFGIVLEWMP
ncbi:hypothetical protein [Chroococcus sp. FPU101]|uniref:hypothetical protein n=1 Tax=Chroococcus sp. FPU101 TaxID=1974212 RepID=UPI001AAA76EC|nr:hypothetical protein [Chroococcus sp. FPU101]GFE68356.1 hypothetical protein CFPU101_09660 [Chroococcus sp. FPU101]